jgi:hypothetical protein
MKLSILIAVAAGALLLTLAPKVSAARGCSSASIIGTFGYTHTGTRIDGGNPGPRAEVGTFTADGHGNLTGSKTKSENGTITQGVTFTGTYSVNSDCTGSATITNSDGDVRHVDLVILKNHEINWIQTDDGRAATGDAKPLAKH